jgi:serine/threonine-protein phosphatase PP1 catalytic subunit
LAIECLKLDPIVLHLSAPLSICGDIHGQFYDLLEFFRIGGRPPDTNYLFLGDYVDRGNNSVEVFSLLLALKVRHPHNVWLLRGNHESAGIARVYGFFSECALPYSQSIWGAFTAVFQWLPFVAIIDGRILCVHGGLSPEMVDIRQLECVKRPVEILSQGMLSDVVSADHCNDHPDFMPSLRGTSYTYRPDVTDMFMRMHGLELICRGHQVVPSGVRLPLQAKLLRPDCVLCSKLLRQLHQPRRNAPGQMLIRIPGSIRRLLSLSGARCTTVNNSYDVGSPFPIRQNST